MVRGGHTDLLGEKGHDGEDDERHEHTVRPELQLVPIHSPGGKKRHILVRFNNRNVGGGTRRWTGG